MRARTKLELQRSLGALLAARTTSDREGAYKRLVAAGLIMLDSPLPEGAAEFVELKAEFPAASASSPRLEGLSDAQLAAFNELLPWAAMTLDGDGRPIGTVWSSRKRGAPQPLSNPRITSWNEAFPLAGQHVLELGCFEGIHTQALLDCGARVTAVDGRPENILKSMTRLWLYGRQADLVLWDLEGPPPPDAPTEWDALSHIGVLYHLSDPVAHLREVLPRTRTALLLDTHAARDEQIDDAYEAAGRAWPFHRFAENATDLSPFTGLRDHSKWLAAGDLVDLISDCGFGVVKVVEQRDERNGLRVLIHAFR